MINNRTLKIFLVELIRMVKLNLIATISIHRDDTRQINKFNHLSNLKPKNFILNIVELIDFFFFYWQRKLIISDVVYVFSILNKIFILIYQNIMFLMH